MLSYYLTDKPCSTNTDRDWSKDYYVAEIGGVSLFFKLFSGNYIQIKNPLDIELFLN